MDVEFCSDGIILNKIAAEKVVCSTDMFQMLHRALRALQHHWELLLGIMALEVNI